MIAVATTVAMVVAIAVAVAVAAVASLTVVLGRRVRDDTALATIQRR